jgi:hypothetical protein
MPPKAMGALLFNFAMRWGLGFALLRWFAWGLGFRGTDGWINPASLYGCGGLILCRNYADFLWSTPCGCFLGSPLPPLIGGKGKNTIKGINEGFSLLEVCRTRLYVCSGFSQKTILTFQKFFCYQTWQFSWGRTRPPGLKMAPAIFRLRNIFCVKNVARCRVV